MMKDRPLQDFAGGRVTIDLYAGRTIEVELQELLGVGAFGRVWKAADRQSDKLYALKIIENIDPDSTLAKRFRLEAEVAIPSENAISSLGFREWDDRTYLILFEYFAGIPLHSYIARYQPTPAEKRKIFEQILIGVGEAHRCNIIHRDLKPANILVGDRAAVKVIDFGMAKFKEHNLTAKERAIVGTYPWMAPEIFIRGAGIADAKVDIYALGQIFYEMATGQHFWVRKGWGLNGFEKFIKEYLQSTPAPAEAIELRDFNEGFYPNSLELVARMVKIIPEQRYSSIAQILGSIGHQAHNTSVYSARDWPYPVLIIESGSNQGAKTLVNLAEGEKIIFGRSDLAGNDRSISRKHIEITRQNERYFLRDLGSKNGTLVAGNLLEPQDLPVEIQDGDRIKVGDIFLRFVFVENF